MTIHNKDLKRLSELDNFRFANDALDIRGMQVKQNNGKVIGKIKDLVIDPEKEKVRYLSIELNKSAFENIRYHRTLVPVGVAEYGENKDSIIIDNLGVEAMKLLPELEDKELTRDLEQALVKAFDPGADLDKKVGADFYETKLFDMGKFYSSRKKEEKARFGRFPPHQ